MTAKVSLGLKNAYFNVSGNGFRFNLGGSIMDGSGGDGDKARGSTLGA